MQIWFYDGSVRCFSGWHILLAAMALISLLSLTLLIPLVAAALHFEFLSKRVRHKYDKLTKIECVYAESEIHVITSIILGTPFLCKT